MTEVGITLQLPVHDHDIDCVDDRGDFAISPCWEFKAHGFGTAENVAATVTAWSSWIVGHR